MSQNSIEVVGGNGDCVSLSHILDAGQPTASRPAGLAVGPGGTALTDDSGHDSVLSTGADRIPATGLILGKYKVIFSRMVLPDGNVWVPDPDVSEGPATRGAREELPMQYSMAMNSKFIVDVQDGGPSLDFTLKKKR